MTKDNILAPLEAIAQQQYEEKKQKRKPKSPSTKPTTSKKPPENLISSISDEELAEVYDEIILDRELGTRSMRDYAKMCWKHVEPGIPYDENSWHSDCLSDHLQAVVEGDIKKIIINVPPGSGKSTWANIFTSSYAWIRMPWWKMAYGSYDQSLMNRDAEKTLKLIKSKWWQDRWGHRFEITKSAIQKINNSMGGIRAVSSIRGQTLGIRADLVVADDPLNILQVNSEVERANVIFWWTNGMRTRGNVDQREIIIMQRLHDGDLAGYLIAEVGGYEVLKLPAEYVPEKKCVTFTRDGTKFWEDPREKDGELLFESHFPLEYLNSRGREATDDTSRSLYSAMFQQEPVQPGGNIIKTNWFRYYSCSPEEQYAKCRRAILSCDPAVKEKDTSTYTVIQIWGVSGVNLYLIDQLRQRLSFTGILEGLNLMIRKWNEAKGPGISAKLIEDKATGPAIIDTLQNKYPGMIAFPADDDKEDRMQAISWMWEAGNVHVPGKVAREGEHKVDFSHVPWMDGDEGWFAEITRFPKARYSDQAITMSQALMHIGQQMKNLIGYPTAVGGSETIYKLRQITSNRRWG